MLRIAGSNFYSVHDDCSQLQKHLLNKMEYLVLGANRDMCLEKMRGQAYLIQKEERAEERNKPMWSVLILSLTYRYACAQFMHNNTGFHFLRKK